MAARRILVVDDGPGVVELESVLLTSAGHKVASACTTPQAIRLIEENGYDVLITDLCIDNRTDGFILASLFKRANRGGTTILNTGSSDISANLHDFQCMVDRVIMKPAPPSDILNAVECTGPSELRPGRKRLADLLYERRQQITDEWLRQIAADPALRPVAEERRMPLNDVGSLIDAVIARVAEPAAPQNNVRQAQLRLSKSRLRAGYSPVAVTVEVLHLQNAINLTIQADLLFINLGSLWRDILIINQAIGASILALLHEITPHPG